VLASLGAGKTRRSFREFVLCALWANAIGVQLRPATKSSAVRSDASCGSPNGRVMSSVAAQVVRMVPARPEK